jgi:hypothetical protein
MPISTTDCPKWCSAKTGNACSSVSPSKNTISFEKKIEVDLSEHKNVFILDDGADFEKYLIDTNYIDVIKKTFISLYGSALSLFTICSAITGANLVFCDVIRSYKARLKNSFTMQLTLKW